MGSRDHIVNRSSILQHTTINLVAAVVFLAGTVFLCLYWNNIVKWAMHLGIPLIELRLTSTPEYRLS